MTVGIPFDDKPTLNSFWEWTVARYRLAHLSRGRSPLGGVKLLWNSEALLAGRNEQA